MGHAFLYSNGGKGKKVPVLNSSYPQNATVTAGDTVTFSVLIAEDGKPAAYTYQWYVNGGLVSGEPSQNYTRNTSNDSGVYTVYCEVTNKAGTVTSRTASLVVRHRLTVNSNANATITATSGGQTVSGTCNSSGAVTLTLTAGTWTVTATNGGVSKSTQVTVNSNKSITLIANQIPAFTYTGSYQIVNDSDIAISGSADNWRIKFLTSGTLKFTQLYGAANGIDVFCVGGGGGGGAAYGKQMSEGYFASGGGGGGGGYTKTQKGVSVSAGTSYAITVGAGGSAGNAGGTTSAFSISASGGSAGNAPTVANTGGTGGAGGSNGGTGGSYSNTSTTTPGSNGSPGQGSTTTAFASGSGKKYSGGGGGGQGRNAYGNLYSANVAGGADTGAASHTSAAANGGGGGGGGSSLADNGEDVRAAGYGGSGIVIIRNKR